jgi:hypothetical protein
MLIGLNGWPSSGKDTVAGILVDELGYRQYALADKVREALYLVNPLVVSGGAGGDLRVRDVVDLHGWDKAKRHPAFGTEIRQLMQRVGTESARTVFGDAVWVDTLSSTIDRDLRITHDDSPRGVVVSDVRLTNEAEWVIERGGVVVRIERAGIGPVNNHASEQPLPVALIGSTVANNGSLVELRAAVLHLAEKLLNPAVATG